MLDYFYNRQNDIVNLLQKMVQYESPTHHKEVVDLFGSFLHERLIELGAEVTLYPRDTVGDIRLAKWNANLPGKPILILGHIDTVWAMGTLENNVPLRLEDGKLHGPGALDMKAGIAIAFEAIRGLQERGEMPPRPIWRLLTTDEETGSDHSREFIIELAQQCGLCLVMEPATDNEGLKTSRKGIARYWITARGIASHAGAAPEQGINAIIELAHQAIAVHKLNALRQGTSVSVTTIQGGTATNVIPAEASLYIDVRFFYREEAERINMAIHALQPVLPGSKLEIRGFIDRYPFERTEQVIVAYQQAAAIASKLGFVLGEGAVGGVSDGNLTAAAGVTTLDGLGGHGDGMHAFHEHVLVRSLPRRVALLAGILRDWQFDGE